jgi:hypothetical protein
MHCVDCIETPDFPNGRVLLLYLVTVRPLALPKGTNSGAYSQGIVMRGKTNAIKHLKNKEVTNFRLTEEEVSLALPKRFTICPSNID